MEADERRGRGTVRKHSEGGAPPEAMCSKTLKAYGGGKQAVLRCSWLAYRWLSAYVAVELIVLWAEGLVFVDLLVLKAGGGSVLVHLHSPWPLSHALPHR